MAPSVGDAVSSYVVNGNNFTVTYKGDYDCDLKQPTPLQSLAKVLGKFDAPILANRTCSQNCFKSDTGFTYVTVTIPVPDTSCYNDACEAVFSYLTNQFGYLNTTTSRQCNYLKKKSSAYLEIYAPYE